MNQRQEKRQESVDPSEVEELKSRLDRFENKLYAAKVAYLNRTPFEGEELSYQGLTTIAKEYIQASYALQKAKFGSVKVKFSVAKLLR